MKISEFLSETIEQFRYAHGDDASRLAHEIVSERFPLKDKNIDLGEYLAQSLRNVGVDLPDDVSL